MRIQDFSFIWNCRATLRFGPFGTASHSLSGKHPNQACATCMAVNWADLAVLSVWGVKITRPKNFQVVKKTAQQFFSLAYLGDQFHGLALLVGRDLDVSLGGSQLPMPGQLHDGLDAH
jgi:hypothetical protein